MFDMSEESKDTMQTHLDNANLRMFEDLLEKDFARGLLKRKLLPKNVKCVGHC